MSYKLDLDTTDRVVRVKVNCLLNNSIRKEILNKIAIQMKSTNYTKAIIDLTESSFDSSEPIDGSVELTIYMSSIGLNPKAKLAFVYVDAETHRKTFERISQRIGYQLRYFKNTDDAYDWLRRS